MAPRSTINIFVGIPDVFEDVRALVKDVRDVSVEFYIVSSGLQDLIMGSGIVQKYFSGVYACQLDDEDAGYVHHVKRCVTFTEKTRFLFEINKGSSRPTRRCNRPMTPLVPLSRSAVNCHQQPLHKMDAVQAALNRGYTGKPANTTVELSGSRTCNRSSLSTVCATTPLPDFTNLPILLDWLRGTSRVSQRPTARL
ncbi:MAG: hypothetical protein QOI95_2886 [Acidimicrobiaceae bacterium]|jgi:hypothetical protein